MTAAAAAGLSQKSPSVGPLLPFFSDPYLFCVSVPFGSSRSVPPNPASKSDGGNIRTAVGLSVGPSTLYPSISRHLSQLLPLGPAGSSISFISHLFIPIPIRHCMDSTLFHNSLLAILIGSFLIFFVCVLVIGALSDRGLCCHDTSFVSHVSHATTNGTHVVRRQHDGAGSDPLPVVIVMPRCECGGDKCDIPEDDPSSIQPDESSSGYYGEQFNTGIALG